MKLAMSMIPKLPSSFYVPGPQNLCSQMPWSSLFALHYVKLFETYRCNFFLGFKLILSNSTVCVC